MSRVKQRLCTSMCGDVINLQCCRIREVKFRNAVYSSIYIASFFLVFVSYNERVIKETYRKAHLTAGASVCNAFVLVPMENAS